MRTKILTIFLILCFCKMAESPVLADNNLTSTTTTRLAGQTRYETAKVISEQYNQGKVQNVVLSTGNGFADALSASVLAHQKDAPIMLVDSTVDGSKDSFDYITQHLDSTGTVYIIGGTGVICKEFETRLNTLGFNNIVRIAGYDRYETSYQLARSLNNTSVSTVVISSGESYSDALSIASIAANKGWPILLTPQASLTQEMKDFLLEKKPSKVYLTGGTGVILDNVKFEISRILPQASIERLAGQDRFDTNAIIAQTFKPNPTTVYLATGYGFADALAGSALAAKNGDPIIFIDPSVPTLPKSVASYFGKLNASNLSPNIIVFGGSGVVSDEVLKNSSDLISGVVKEDSIYLIDDIIATVTQNQAYLLPTTVPAKLYSSETIDVPVKWTPSSVDTSTIGTSTYEGVVDGYSKIAISLTLNVEQDDGALASVKIEGKYGFINKSGKVIFYLNDYQLINSTSFSEGLIPVMLNSKCGFLDNKGNVAIPIKYDECRPFQDGLAAVKLNRKWGYIDKNGNEVIPISYPELAGDWQTGRDFSEGMAIVSKGYNRFGAIRGFIDKNDKLVIPYKYEECKYFNEGFAAVQLNYKWGFVDKNGNEVVSPKYDFVEDFSEGLAAVCLNHKWGFVNTNGQEVVPLKYDSVGNGGFFGFSEGLAIVHLNNKSGFIDKNGQEVIALKYDSVYRFSEGLAAVSLNNKCGFIDKFGQEVIPLKYFRCYEFEDGLACVILNGEVIDQWGSVRGKRGMIDKNGKVIVPFEYEHISGFSEGLAIVDNADAYTGIGKYGFINKMGNEVIPLIYDEALGFRK